MAISTYGTYLMYKESGAYVKLLDIKDFPDLGGVPEMIETTTLSDSAQTFITGIQSGEAKSFTANYTSAAYNTVKGLETAGDELDFAVYFGHTISGSTATPTGDDGKFEFKGTISVYVTGGGVNDPIEMVVTIAPSTPIVKVTI